MRRLHKIKTPKKVTDTPKEPKKRGTKNFRMNARKFLLTYSRVPSTPPVHQRLPPLVTTFGGSQRRRLHRRWLATVVGGGIQSRRGCGTANLTLKEYAISEKRHATLRVRKSPVVHLCIAQVKLV
jgi:hypothetical protein